MLLLAAILGGPGCGEPVEPSEPEVPGPLGQLYLDYLAAIDASTMSICACHVASGFYDDVVECWVSGGGPAQPPPLAECVAQAYEGQDAAQETLECLLDRQSTYLDCLQQSGCDANALYECEERYYAATCPTQPYEVTAVITEACYGYALPPPFYCGDGTAIPEYWVCDRQFDCVDRSDELDCPPPPDSFLCGSGEYVPNHAVCDQFPDCLDESDELDCPPPPDSFLCGSGEYVPAAWVCDGQPNCADGSDELDCPPPPDSFLCGSGEYVPAVWVCDGFPDCADGSDELECPAPPPPFVCGSGESVPGERLCDGEPDCVDGSDEAACESTLAAALGAREPARPATR